MICRDQGVRKDGADYVVTEAFACVGGHRFTLAAKFGHRFMAVPSRKAKQAAMFSRGKSARRFLSVGLADGVKVSFQNNMAGYCGVSYVTSSACAGDGARTLRRVRQGQRGGYGGC